MKKLKTVNVRTYTGLRRVKPVFSKSRLLCYHGDIFNGEPLSKKRFTTTHVPTGRALKSGLSKKNTIAYMKYAELLPMNWATLTANNCAERFGRLSREQKKMLKEWQ